MREAPGAATWDFCWLPSAPAVGLGNIWGFPYKMGKSGGFTFLIVYLLLAVFVGFIVMVSELAMGRKGGPGGHWVLSHAFQAV